MPDPSTLFDTQLILDADYSEDAGWEVSVRFDAESQEVGWGDMDDAALKLAVGESIAQVLIDARAHNATPDQPSSLDQLCARLRTAVASGGELDTSLAAEAFNRLRQARLTGDRPTQRAIEAAAIPPTRNRGLES